MKTVVCPRLTRLSTGMLLMLPSAPADTTRMARAFRVADDSAVQSMKLPELDWATIPGLLMFGTILAGLTVAGGGVILASTLRFARRESRTV